jgi:anthranilate synthase component 1
MRVITDRDRFRSTADEATGTARVPVELRLRVADPFEAYRRARRGDGGDVFLETTGGQPGWGYFAIEPEERVTVSADAVSIDGSSPSLATLDSVLGSETIERGGCETPYPCGLIGWLSYDIAREIESLPDGTEADCPGCSWRNTTGSSPGGNRMRTRPNSG